MNSAAGEGGGSARPVFAQAGSPAVMPNRIAHAIAACALRGKDAERMPKRPLGVSDSPKTAQEDFDRHTPHPDQNRQEKRPAGAKTMAARKIRPNARHISGRLAWSTGRGMSPSGRTPSGG